MDKENLLQLNVDTIFIDTKYVVPIYQRNYAWEAEQIIQLIEDIDSSIDKTKGTYFLGNLIVNQTDTGTFEVIDGQQRLTTLFILETYLEMTVPNDSLHFEARDKSNRTLEHLSGDLSGELYSAEILNGYQIIADYFEQENLKNNNFREEFKSKLNSVKLVRVQVPKNIDLNHYFEIMNTRGEQLELHEVAKARFLNRLSTEKERTVADSIWNACANMNSYVQMNFDKNIRQKLFKEDWSDLDEGISSFYDMEPIFSDNEVSDKKTLREFLDNKVESVNAQKEAEEENNRFESILSFPNFLLQVNRIMASEKTLDDKNFIKFLEWNWEKEETAKTFLFNLLKYRVLFDSYILKREFKGDYKESGKWSLQKLEKSTTDGKDKPNYSNTFGEQTVLLRTLQSCLRITYTSPRTMDWVSDFLRKIDEKPIQYDFCKDILENYCRQKVKEVNYKNQMGFGIQRIVFTYLDYLLYRDGYNDIISKRPQWEFQFRNSIEHFYPQNPIDIETWKSENLDNFGNLALITVSGNSKFSNLSPKAKIDTYPSIINQSLKLQLMKKLVEEKGWNEDVAKNHGKEMTNILENDIDKN